MKIIEYLEFLNKQIDLNYKVIILDFKHKKILDSNDDDYYKFLKKEILTISVMKCKTYINNKKVDLIYYVITPK